MPCYKAALTTVQPVLALIIQFYFFQNKYLKMFELPHPEGNVKVMLLFSCISQQVKYKLLPVKTDGGFDNSNWLKRQVDDG